MFSLALTQLLYVAVVVQCGFPGWSFGKCHEQYLGPDFSTTTGLLGCPFQNVVVV